ncbi:hypothetical protein Z043_117925 [Scleropages formosus]|uniref:Uncharacterized protein n=1 Tax=Scleropages formosus TaxID=113540 RepID=A0A0N8JXH9_SCLFO|nr:hypothetical protein Z043_117925 [Scleropages formosus]
MSLFYPRHQLGFGPCPRRHVMRSDEDEEEWEVALLGIDILSALVTRLQDRFRTQIGTVLPSLIDRLGDAKDQVREQDQTLLLKIMEQAANPQYVWDRMLGGFKHKNNRTREGVCLCLIATLSV